VLWNRGAKANDPRKLFLIDPATHLSPTFRNGARTSRHPIINVIMAPNMQSFEALPICLHVPKEDTRVRCALLGCGMVRHPLAVFEVCHGHADSGATVECVSKSSFQPYHCLSRFLCSLYVVCRWAKNTFPTLWVIPTTFASIFYVIHTSHP
jgi:hypothetical protein